MTGSLDVESLYPSIDTKEAARICKERVINSPLTFDGVDYQWAVLYLTYTMTPIEKVDSGLIGVLPRKKNKQGRKATIASIGTMDKEGKDKWWYPKDPKLLTHEEKRQILGNIVQQLVTVVFNTHFYIWNGKIYHQQGGAPMGLRSACPISRAVMDFWVNQVKETEERTNTLSRINPVMYSRLDLYLLSKYVDDVITALEKFRPGTRWDPTHKVFIWTPEAHQEDLNQNMELITMTEFSKMASSLLGCLNFTWDSPEKNEGKTMPVLDTQVWVGWGSRKWGVPEAALEEGTPLP